MSHVVKLTPKFQDKEALAIAAGQLGCSVMESGSWTFIRQQSGARLLSVSAEGHVTTDSDWRNRVASVFGGPDLPKLKQGYSEAVMTRQLKKMKARSVRRRKVGDTIVLEAVL